MANNFSILINVYNEQKDLRGCIESVGFSDDIVVYDSYSTDNTLDIARSVVREYTAPRTEYFSSIWWRRIAAQTVGNSKY